MQTRSAAVAGAVMFAAIILIMSGCFNVIDGLIILIKGHNYVLLSNSGTLAFNLTGWGWIFLIFGVAEVAAGIGLWSGQLWARIVGIAVAFLNALAHLSFLGTYPVWSVIVIAVDILVIYALTVYSEPLSA